MPNTGKSTFFNRLTGASARVGNWPGITVDLLGAKILLGGDMVEVVDLPGLYDLHGFSEDELESCKVPVGAGAKVIRLPEALLFQNGKHSQRNRCGWRKSCICKYTLYSA